MAETLTQAGPKAGQEMEAVVELLNGRWDMAVTYQPNELMPQGGTFEGQEVNRPGPGRHSVIVDSISSGPAGRFEGFGIIHWSDADQLYKLYWFTNTSAVPAMFNGKWEGRHLIFDGTETVMGKRLASRHSITNIKPDSFHDVIDMGPTTADLKTFITIQYTRAKTQDR